MADPKYVCGGCGREYAPRSDGLIRFHSVGFGGYQMCGGALQPPAGVSQAQVRDDIRTVRPRQPRQYRKRDPYNENFLEVTCWCEDTVVVVPKAEVAAGHTRSCGLPGCAPEREAV